MSKGTDTRDTRAIAAIACPRCGAPKGEPCRRKMTRPGTPCCQERRQANQHRLRNK